MIESAVILAVSATPHKTELRDKRPRAMLPALGKPMFIRVMDKLYHAGIRHYVVIVGIDEGQVASYLNSRWMPDAKIELIVQSDQKLSTLMAKIAQQLNRPFLFASYNSFTFEHFVQALLKQHQTKQAHLIIAGASHSLSPTMKNNYYALMNEERVTAIVKDMPPTTETYFTVTEHAICGEEFVRYLQENTHSARTWFGIVKNYLQMEQAQVSIAESSWVLRVEDDAHLLMLTIRLLEESTDGHILCELPYTVKIIPPVRVDPQVSIGQNAVIGPNVYIEQGSSIGYGTTIRNALVLTKSIIEPHTEIENAIVMSKSLIQF